MNPVIYEILRWVQYEQKEDCFLLLFNPDGTEEFPVASIQWDEERKAWLFTSEETNSNGTVLAGEETLEDAIDEAERIMAAFYESQAECSARLHHAFQEGLRTLHSILNKKCRGCRWRALKRYQKCSCCARNYRNLKDLYEKEKE